MRETVSLMKVGELDLIMTWPVTTSRSTADPPREESLEERRDDSASISLTSTVCGIGSSSGKVSITSSLPRSVTRADIFGRGWPLLYNDLSPLTEVDAEDSTGVVATTVVVVEVTGAVEVKNLSLALIVGDGFGEELSFG